MKKIKEIWGTVSNNFYNFFCCCCCRSQESDSPQLEGHGLPELNYPLKILENVENEGSPLLVGDDSLGEPKGLRRRK